ncbi:MAG: hypothetical protein AAF415_09915 [Pseudomonadota bacterium]
MDEAALYDPESPGFFTATAFFLINALLEGLDQHDLQLLLDSSRRAFRKMPAEHRAAVFGGFRQARARMREPNCAQISHQDCVSLDPEKVIAALVAMAKSADREARESVVQTDGHSNPEKHRAALDEVTDSQDCVMTQEQSWYPSEAVELAAYCHGLPGFGLAHAILLTSAISAGSGEYSLHWRWAGEGLHILALPPDWHQPICAAYRYLYESDPDWEPEIVGRKRQAAPIPVLPLSAPRFLVESGVGQA